MTALAHDYPQDLVYFDVTLALAPAGRPEALYSQGRRRRMRAAGSPRGRGPELRYVTVCDPGDSDAVQRSITDLAHRDAHRLPSRAAPHQSLKKVGIWIGREPVELLSFSPDAKAALYGSRACRDGGSVYLVLHREEPGAAVSDPADAPVRVSSCPHLLSIREVVRKPDGPLFARYGLDAPGALDQEAPDPAPVAQQRGFRAALINLLLGGRQSGGIAPPHRRPERKE